MTTTDEQELRELDHSEEDETTRELVGFANDLLAYAERMDKAGSPILFIHKYVAKRRKRVEALIQRKQIEARLRELEFYEKQLRNRNFDLSDCMASMAGDIATLKSQLPSSDDQGKEKV